MVDFGSELLFISTHKIQMKTYSTFSGINILLSLFI